jgi:hypothetical protein
MPAFLTRWLAKEQNRGGGPQPRAPAGDGAAAETMDQYAERVKVAREEDERRRREAAEAPKLNHRAGKGAPC